MRRFANIVLLVLSFLSGYVVREVKRLIDEANAPVMIAETRLAELTKANCREHGEDQTNLLSSLPRMFDDPATPFSDMVIERVNGERGCTFDYWMRGDSLVQGRGVMVSVRGRVAEIKFYNRLDVRLLKGDEPSFSVRFYRHQGEVYATETMTNRLYRIDGGIRKIGR